MADFSSSDVLLAAAVEIRVKEDLLRKDLARAKQTVQQTTDAMTKMSISKMKDRSKALTRLDKLEQQQTVRSVQAKIAANKTLGRTVAKSISDNKKAATEKLRTGREVARVQRDEIGRLGRMSSAFRMLGVQVTIAGAIITATFKKMLDQFIKFETSMRRATAVTTFSLAQYTQMSKMAEDASKSLNIAASSTADAFYFLGSAGLSAENQMKAFIPVVTLAKAAVIDAGQAAEIMVDTMKGFKISFEETEHVAAVLAKSVISSNMNFLQLGETLSLVAGVARTTNNSLEETAAMIQLMANVGIKGTRAGTTLRRSMLNLSAPSAKIQRLFSQLSIEIETQSGKIKPYVQLVGEISDALKDATEGQKQMAFKTLFGARAIAGQIEVFGAGAAAIRSMVRELELVGDTHEEIAKKQLVAFGEEVGKIKQEIADLSRHLSSKFVPTLKSMSKWIGDVTGKLKKFSDRHELLSGTIVGTGLAMGGLLLISGAALTTLASLALVATGLGIGFLTLTIATAGVAAVLALLIGAVTFMIVKSELAKQKIKALNDEIKRNTTFLKNAAKANREWADSFGRITPTKQMERIQKATEAMQLSIQRSNTALGMLSRMLIRPDVIPESNIRELAEQHNIEPIIRTKLTKGQFGQTIITSVTIDKKATIKAIIEIEREKVARAKRTIEVLRGAETKAHQAALDDQAKLRGATAIWSRETLEETVSMYDKIRGHADEYFSTNVNLLEELQKEQLKNFKQNEFFSEKIKDTQISNFKKIQAEHKRILIEEFELEKAMRSDSFIGGLQAGTQELIRDLKTAGQHGVEMANTIKESMSSAFATMVEEGGTFKDAMVAFATDIRNAFAKIAADKLAAAAISGGISTFSSFLGGGGNVSSPSFDPGGELVMHRGGLVGATTGIRRVVSPGTFNNAPRLHKGLNPDEFPAILQSGERVIPRGQSSALSGTPDITVNIINESSNKLTTETSNIRFDINKMIIDVIVKDYQQNGPTRNLFNG